MTEAVGLVCHGIKCDAPGCGYVDPEATLEELEKYLNQPCPRCGSILLTDADWSMLNLLLSAREYANVMIGPVPDGSERVNVRINMNGSGIPEIAPTESEVPNA